MNTGLLSSLEKPVQVDWEENPVRTFLAFLAKGIYWTAVILGFLVFGLLYWVFYIVFAGLGEKGYK